jgi:hypothetical protein
LTPITRVDVRCTMATDEEKADPQFRHMTEADWAGVDRARALKREMEERHRSNPPEPTWEERVLALLREQTELLREIRDLLRPSKGGGR